MDFLDPKKKRYNRIKLGIGHTFMVLLVFVSTYILVLKAYGYDFDRKTGEVIQNGLIYVDSAPDGATIKINGQEHDSKTNTRITLPEGNYTMEISKPGYRTWSRNFYLNGGKVLRYTYPTLFPSALKSSELQNFDGTVQFVTQSPSRRWIIVDQNNNLASMTLFDLEKRAKDDKPTVTSLSFPGSLFSASPGKHTIKLTEWSTDNRHILVQHSWPKGQEFVMLDIEQPAKSYNVNKTIGQNPSQVSLFDKNFEKLFIYNNKTKALQRVDVKTKSIKLFANNIVSYKPHGNDTVLMSQVDGKDKTKADVIIRQKDKDYTIRQIPIASNIPLDIARYSNAWYIGFGVASEHKTYIYKNPLDFIEGKFDSSGAFVLKNSGAPEQVSFSNNTRFIMSSSGQSFSVYDAEESRYYSYILKDRLDANQKPYWMDGHRILASSGGKVIVFDYDGINKQVLVKANPKLPVMFNRDYVEMYTLGDSSAKAGKSGLFVTQLRLPADK